jgi:hypothetical protein
MSLWLWTGVWLVALAFLVPALMHYGESHAIDSRADGLLLMLLFLSYPVSALGSAVLSAFTKGTPVEGFGFVVMMLWWFVAGYLQWFLVLRLIRGSAGQRPPNR